MMMFIRSRCKVYEISRLYGALLYSTEAVVSSSSALLESRIFGAGDPRVSMVPILNQWVQQGNDVTQRELQTFVSRLSYYRRFTHALQVSEWMSNEMSYDLSPGDIAKRINLISKVHGPEQVERFISGIPDAKIGFKIRAALLSCYAKHKSLKKAEAFMKKIKECHPMHLTVCYNMMLKLYAQMGKYEKLESLMQEMKERDLCNGATFTIRLNAYVATKDIAGMEKLLMQMEADPLATVDWYTYATAANGYTKAGNFEKSLSMLKKSERLVRANSNSRRVAYESLQSIYAAIGNKGEVYRLWNRLKNFKKPHNSSYVNMLSSMLKLGDIEGAESVLAEWESESTSFDTRIPNLMISVYCKMGMLSKAEAYIRKLLDTGKELNGSTWDRLATGYCMDNDMGKAVQTMKKALLECRPGWRPRPFTLVQCIEYLKGKGELELAMEILKLWREQGHISTATHDRLVSSVHGEISYANALDLVKGDYQMDKDVQQPDGLN